MLFFKKIIDKKTFLEVVGDEKEMISTIIELFLEQSADCLKTMRLSIDQLDPDNFKRAAHDLKNVGRNIACNDLIILSEELELIGEKREIDGVGDGIDKAEKILKKAHKELLEIQKSVS